MAYFVIDGFDFGVDPKCSAAQVTDGLLSLKVAGDESVLGTLTITEEHP